MYYYYLYLTITFPVSFLLDLNYPGSIILNIATKVMAIMHCISCVHSKCSLLRNLIFGNLIRSQTHVGSGQTTLQFVYFQVPTIFLCLPKCWVCLLNLNFHGIIFTNYLDNHVNKPTIDLIVGFLSKNN